MTKHAPRPEKSGADGAQPSEGEPNYEVGYRRPPVGTQFKHGHRGRGGRPKGQRNINTVVHGLVHERITVCEGGRSRRMTKRDVMLLKLVNKATSGDDKALARVLSLMAAAETAEASKQQGFTRNDEAVIADFLRRQGTEVKPEESAEPNATSQTGIVKDPSNTKETKQ